MTPHGYLSQENALTIKVVARNRVKTIFYDSKCRRDKFLLTFNGKKSMRIIAIEQVARHSTADLKWIVSLE